MTATKAITTASITNIRFFMRKVLETLQRFEQPEGYVTTKTPELDCPFVQSNGRPSITDRYSESGKLHGLWNRSDRMRTRPYGPSISLLYGGSAIEFLP